MSLALDGELSEVEHAWLRAHVGRCAACAGFARDVDALTLELRDAPLERPLLAVLPPRRRSARYALQLGAAAAAVAIAAGFGSVAGSLTSAPGTHIAAARHVSFGSLRALRTHRAVAL